MGLTAFLEAAIGLGLVYLLTSILCSGINEALAQELNRRGRFLREGMRNLVPDRWLYLRVISHPMVAALYRNLPGKPHTPSYIPAGNFTSALLDTLRLKAAQLDGIDRIDNPTTTTFDNVRSAVIKCRNAGVSVADGLLPLIDSAEGNLQTAQRNIEAWYESGMDRVSGWYKRYARRLLLLTGLIIAVLCNVDTIQIVTSLAKSSALRRSLADMASEITQTKNFGGVSLDVDSETVKIAEGQLSQFAQRLSLLEEEGLPIGFSCLSMNVSQQAESSLTTILAGCWSNTLHTMAGAWFLKILGWLITALAVSLGAPFWFDLLNRLVDIRGSGRKPDKPAKAS
jgi:hypothetical protein